MIKAIEYKTLKEYKEANLKAHNLLKDLDGYNSPMYASETPIESINGTYLLPLLVKFEKELKKGVFIFNNFEKSYIKVNEE